MRFVTCRTRSRTAWGVVDGGCIHLAPASAEWPSGLAEIIDGGLNAALSLGRRIIAGAGETVSVDEAALLAPLPRPRKNVLCLGLNYADHAEESARAKNKPVQIPEHPVVFTKAPTTVSGPFDDVICDPAVTGQADWEVELGVVIGRRTRRVTAAQALDQVFGYTVINDLTARDLQFRHKQFFIGKSVDGFCPMGPVIVTADEIVDPQALTLVCRVNGQEKQRGTTADQIFGVAETIHRVSQSMMLEPGDIIATGTPAGVGFARNPPECLFPGDTVECEIEGVGVIRNRIVAP